MQTYYELLGVSRNASREEIKQAYFRIADPYVGFTQPPNFDSGGCRQVNRDSFVLISKAYKTLLSNEKRAQYDFWLSKALLQESPKAFVEISEDEENSERDPVPSAFGKFGVVSADERPSAIESALEHPAPVSETLKAQSTWTRIFRIMGMA